MPIDYSHKNDYNNNSNESEVETIKLLEEIFEQIDEEHSELLETEKQEKMYMDFTESFLIDSENAESDFISLYHEAKKNAFIAGFNVAKQLIK